MTTIAIIVYDIGTRDTVEMLADDAAHVAIDWLLEQGVVPGETAQRGSCWSVGWTSFAAAFATHVADAESDSLPSKAVVSLLHDGVIARFGDSEPEMRRITAKLADILNSEA